MKLVVIRNPSDKKLPLALRRGSVRDSGRPLIFQNRRSAGVGTTFLGKRSAEQVAEASKGRSLCLSG
jgi:hypothetical protein